METPKIHYLMQIPDSRAVSWIAIARPWENWNIKFVIGVLNLAM